MSLFQRKNGVVIGGSRPIFASLLLFPGILLICFGLAILAAPELLAYFVATLLIIGGFSLIGTWYRTRL